MFAIVVAELGFHSDKVPSNKIADSKIDSKSIADDTSQVEISRLNAEHPENMDLSDVAAEISQVLRSPLKLALFSKTLVKLVIFLTSHDGKS